MFCKIKEMHLFSLTKCVKKDENKYKGHQRPSTERLLWFLFIKISLLVVYL